MEGLNAFEQAVLAKMLAGDHPVLAALRVQAEGGRLISREYTGVGFFCGLEPRAGAQQVAPPNFALGEDVLAEMSALEHGAGFVIFVRNGLLSMLEGYTYEGAWPDPMTDFKLRYLDTTQMHRGTNAALVVEVPTAEGPRWLQLPPT